METTIGTLALEAVALLDDAISQIPPQAWDQPSNLDGWSVRELVAHATGGTAKIVALVEGTQIWQYPSRPADWICDDPAGRLEELAGRLRATLPDADLDAERPSPAGEVPARQALAFPVSDLALHAWDIGASCGRQIELPADLLSLSRDLVESVPEHLLRRPGGFGPAQPAPEHATPTAALMAYLGRRPT